MTFTAAAEPHISMRDRIADTIRNAILNGELGPGQRVTEVEIAERLGVSRAPVREAIRELVNEGFLQSLPYRETRVSRITRVELVEVLIPTRIVAETFALRHLMDSAGREEVLAELDRHTEEMLRAAADNDARGVRAGDLAFHRTLVESTPYQHPGRLWTAITPVLYRAFVLGTVEETLRVTAEGHTTLLEAIRSGDLGHAEAVLIEHIDEMRIRFRDDSQALPAGTDVDRLPAPAVTRRRTPRR